MSRIKDRNKIKNKSKRRIVKFFTTLLFILLLATRYLVLFCNAEKIHPRAGTTSATFLKIGVGARPIGMGEAFTAISDDANAIYWNPAGLVRVHKREITGMHNEHFQDIRHDFIGYAHPLKSLPERILGIGVTGLYLYGMERRSGEEENIPEEPLTEEEGKFGADDIALLLGYAEAINSRLSLGGSIKGIRQRIDDEKAYGIALDLGALYRWRLLNKELDIGLVLLNFGPGIKFVNKSYDLPLAIRLGLGMAFLNNRLRVGFDVNQPIDNYVKYHLGFEYRIIRELFIRTGYRYRLHGNALGDKSGMTAGIGLRINDFQLDYAFVPYGELGDTHRISLTLNFGKRQGILEQPQMSRIPKPEKIEREIQEEGIGNEAIEQRPLMISAQSQVWESNIKLNHKCIQEIVVRTNRRIGGDVNLEVLESIEDSEHRVLPDRAIVLANFDFRRLPGWNIMPNIGIRFALKRDDIIKRNIDPNSIEVLQNVKVYNGARQDMTGTDRRFSAYMIEETGNEYIYYTTIDHVGGFKIIGRGFSSQ